MRVLPWSSDTFRTRHKAARRDIVEMWTGVPPLNEWKRRRLTLGGSQGLSWCFFISLPKALRSFPARFAAAETLPPVSASNSSR